jgi:WhiB family redox-sensing transcriptional regulator
MVTPRPTFKATSITRPSAILADPADVFDLNGRDPGEMVAAMDEAADRVRAMIASWRPAWAQDAACVGQPVAVFFGAKGKQAALELCGGCVVRRQCLDEALADPSLDFGIRGGADVAARKLMRRQRQTTKGPTDAEI